MSKNFLANKSAYDITKFTTLDFKDHLSCIIWFAKCNMRCPYCYNSTIVDGEGISSNEELLNFLKLRRGKLDGVVLSGGECTLNPYIIELCKEIKALDYDIKIDTNGLKPDVLKELIDLSLIDFIALDYKAPANKFKAITKNSQIEKFYATLDMLINTNFPFETRTTYHSALLNIDDINEIIEDLDNRNYKGTYYIQNYLHVEDTIEKLPEFSTPINKKLLKDLLPIEIRN